MPPATPFTTAEISFKFLRTVVPQSGTLTAKGRLIHAGKTTGVSLVEVTDQVGRLVAVTSTRCAILPRVEVPWEVIEQRAVEVLEAGRVAEGHVFNLGHGVLPETDPAVLARLADLVHTRSARR